jgi:beta-1,4-mannosyl-glycoprotein beta-1,4-N-acetylglucosaminyltransferase
MIYDCFNFFDELDLLEIRLNILNDAVDKFVIVEAKETFNGKEKPLNFQDNIHRFKKWEDKIIYYVVSEFGSDKEIYNKALASPNTGPNKEHYWVREFYQKEELIKPLLPICKDDDIICVSDIDEIWNPQLRIAELQEFNKEFPKRTVYRPILQGRAFYLDIVTEQYFGDWTGTRIGSFEELKTHGPNHFRTERECPSCIIGGSICGWHFSWLTRKANKWGDDHPDNNGRFERVKSHLPIGVGPTLDEHYLPDYLKTHKNEWKHLFYESVFNT